MQWSPAQAIGWGKQPTFVSLFGWASSHPEGDSEGHERAAVAALARWARCRGTPRCATPGRRRRCSAHCFAASSTA
eukprot:3751453-Prymnesium_polylepis.1